MAEALSLVAAGADAIPIAGGVSLVAIMNTRLLSPGSLVSLRGVAEMEGIRGNADGTIRIGAMTRQRAVEKDTRLERTLACVREAASSIASPAIRNMGTIGGSICLSDPGADLPPALVAANARFEIAGPGGTRTIPAEAFFTGWYTTALQPGELLLAVHLPAPAPGAACYEKLVRVSGDICIASVALSAAGRGPVRAAVGGCGPGPVRHAEADALLSRGLDDPKMVRAAGDILARVAQPMDDVRGSAHYRRMLIPRMLARAVERVRAQLRGSA